ncbi:putative N-acetyltransferase YycN [compost metagenome]
MVEIIYPTNELIPGYYDCLKTVASERIYLEMVEPPPLEKVTEFQSSLIAKGGPVFYAVDAGKVVGWCDIFPADNPTQSHRGGLGMGLYANYRGQGIGAKLVSSSLNQAKQFGLEKVELSVFTNNTGAVKLYKSLGFKEEGLIKNYRKLDGVTFDCLLMAMHLK